MLERRMGAMSLTPLQPVFSTLVVTILLHSQI